MDNTKTCENCGEERPLSMYTGSSASPDGLRYACKLCYGNGYKPSKAYYKKKPREEWVDVSTPNSRAKKEAERLDIKYYKPPTPCKKHPDSLFSTNAGICHECKLSQGRKAHAKKMKEKRKRESRPRIADRTFEPPETVQSWQSL